MHTIKNIVILSASLIALAACSSRHHVDEPKPTFRLTLVPQGSNTLVKLNGIDSRSLIANEDLTQPMRLLLIDPTLTDFHIIIPQKSDVPGMYSFTLPSKSKTDYRVWADVMPDAAISKNQLEEFPQADFGARSIGQVSKVQSLEATISGQHYVLSFDRSPKENYESTGKLLIDGKPAAGSLYGFYDDFHSVVRLPLDNDGTFALTPRHSGFIKLFAQVKQRENIVTVPFGVIAEKDK